MKRLLLGIAAVAVCAAIGLVVAYLLFPDQALDAGRWLRRNQAGLATHAVTVAGHRIVYLEGGSGEALVLLHGFGADKDSWPPVARILTRHFHVFAPDLPGFGESARDPAATYGYADQAGRVEAFTRAVGLASPFHLGGNSMGGGIAGVYAARYPGRLKSLWLIDPAGVISAKPSELIERILRGQNPMLVTTTAEFDALIAMLFVRPPWIPPGLTSALARARAAHRDFDQKVFQDLRGRTFSLEAELRGCTVPTLITWGAQDRLVDVSGAAILAGLMPRATLDIRKDVGHVPMLEQPRATAERYLQFQATLH